MSLRDYYATATYPKASTVCEQRTKKAVTSALERATRKYLDQVRDKRRCFFPNCREFATEKHHIVPRSLGGTWHTGNIVSGCRKHHGWCRGLIVVEGNPDEGTVVVRRTVLGERAGIRVPAREE